MRTYHPGHIIVKPEFEALSVEAKSAFYFAWAALWKTGRNTKEDIPFSESAIRELTEAGLLVPTGDGEYVILGVGGMEREMHRIRARRYRARKANVALTSLEQRDASVTGDVVGTGDENVTSPSPCPPYPISLSREKVTNSFPQPGARKRPPLSPPSHTPLSHPPIVPPPSPLALSSALSPRRSEGTVEGGVGGAAEPAASSFAEKMGAIAGSEAWFVAWMERRRSRGEANGSVQFARAPRPGGVASSATASSSSSWSSKVGDLLRSDAPVSAPPSKPSVSRPSPRSEVRLTREQWEAWRRFDEASPRPEEWRMVQEAWLGRGLRYPPSPRQREVIWPILDARPNDTVRWISEGPRRRSYDVVGHVLGRWREVLRGVDRGEGIDSPEKACSMPLSKSANAEARGRRSRDGDVSVGHLRRSWDRDPDVVVGHRGTGGDAGCARDGGGSGRGADGSPRGLERLYVGEVDRDGRGVRVLDVTLERVLTGSAKHVAFSQ